MRNLNKILIFLISFEIIFGGGGRLLDPLGVPPLRYILFFLSIIVLFLNLLFLQTKTKYSVVILVLMLFILPMLGILIGFARGNPLQDIFFDLQPFLYMLIIPYFCFMSKELNNYSLLKFQQFVKIFSILASVTYLCYVLLLKSGYLDFNLIYNVMSASGEFFFRPSGAFFAKSFFFIGIGAILFFCEKKYFYFSLCMVAIFLTETRGVFLFTGLAVTIASFKINNLRKNILLIFLIVIAMLGMLIIVGDRGVDSDSVRLNDFRFVYDSLGIWNVIFGEGFGASIFGRGRIEVVPLEIFFKVGMLGVIISIIPFLKVIYENLLSKDNLIKVQIACSLIFGLSVSITNPFIYTPMGIYLISIALISLTTVKLGEKTF
ncbi:oligosaccharide repeat unit polymerase [Enterobacteriaceae bacterium Kacie_13]|nr:oligosaccharide repeat unit polymerase [Enterobacteriaceae bacterium Kacie_13]